MLYHFWKFQVMQVGFFWSVRSFQQPGNNNDYRDIDDLNSIQMFSTGELKTGNCTYI